MNAIGRPAVAAFRDTGIVNAARRPPYDWRRLHVFVPGTENELLHQAHLAFANDISPESWCIKLSGNPAVASVLQEDAQTEILDLVILGEDGAIRHMRRQPPPRDGYLGSANPGCIVPFLGVAAGRLICALYRRLRIRGVPIVERGWTNLGTTAEPFDSDPAVYSSHGGLAVAARHAGKIAVKSTATHPWPAGTAWRDVAGDDWSSEITLAPWPGRGLVVCGVTSQGALHMAKVSDGTIELLGDGFVGQPAILSWGTSGLLACMTSNFLLKARYFYASTGWSPWETIPSDGHLWGSSPVALLWQPRGGPGRGETPLPGDFILRQYVFATDTSRKLHFTFRDQATGSWAAWEPLDGLRTLQFAVAPFGVSQLAVYATSSDADLLYSRVLQIV